MANSYTGATAGGLVIQKYNNFRGVDFTDNKTSETRSPDALNMWKNYKTLGKQIETRPDIELQLSMSNTIYGLFFYTINQIDHWIIHCGTSLYDYNPSTEELTTIKENGMNPAKSVFYVFNNILFIKDGINYLEYNGETVSEVVGTVPLTNIARKPGGGGTPYQGVNLLSNYRQNNFIGDGTSTEYHLDSKNISSTGLRVWIWDFDLKDYVLQEPSTYSIDATNGIVTFTTAPEKVDTPNVLIEYSKTISGEANKIKKCTLACLFDNRVFFSGNQDYPNAIFWTEESDPRYISDVNKQPDGDNSSKIKALVPGNDSLWVFKESSQGNTTIFYHQHLDIADDYGTMAVRYPSSHSNITTGCEATGINFNDDIVFFSDMGMEGISGNITTEQVIAHRSTLVDRKLLNETNYKDMVLIEYENYLLVIIDNKVYLADRNQKVSNNDHMEYEWYYWELSKNIKSAEVHDGTLYLCSKEENVLNDNGYKKYTDGTNIYWYDEANTKLYDNAGVESAVEVGTLTAVMASGVYTLTNNDIDRTISSYWITSVEDYNYPQMLKTTNKRGFKSDVTGSSITISSKIDNNNFEELGTYTNTKGYIVAKLKKKKWNSIQLKYSGTKPFGIYAISLEAYIGSYVKRS